MRGFRTKVFIHCFPSAVNCSGILWTFLAPWSNILVCRQHARRKALNTLFFVPFTWLVMSDSIMIYRAAFYGKCPEHHSWKLNAFCPRCITRILYTKTLWTLRKLMYFKIGPRYKRYRCYVHFPKFGCKDLYRLTVVSKMDLNFVRAKYSFHKSEVLLLDFSFSFW